MVRKELVAAKETQKAKRSVEGVKEKSQGIHKEISATPIGKKLQANGMTPK